MAPTANEQAWTARLVEAARSGEALDLAPGVPDGEIEPAGAASWPSERCVPAAALRAALLDPDLKPDPSGLWIRGAYLTGTLNLDHATIPCPLSLTYSAAKNLLRVEYATLPHLDLTGTHLPGLSLDGARVPGNVDLKHLTASGKVRAIGAHIGGHLDLDDATISNTAGEAMCLDMARVDDGVFLTRLKATGEVRAVGAHIGASLGLEGAILTNKEGAILTNKEGEALRCALILDMARIDGSAFLKGLTATGHIRALHAQIGGQLVLAGATLTYEVVDVLNVQETEVSTLGLRRMGRLPSLLLLRGAQVGTLVVDAKTPDGGLPGVLIAAGWRVTDMQGVIRDDRGAAAAWLDTALDHVSQPWHELAAVFERNGQPADARWLRWQAARRITRAAPRNSKPIRCVYGALVGYGYYPLLAAVWLLLALGTTTALTEAHREAFTPTMPAAAALPTAPTSTPGPPAAPTVTPGAPPASITGDTPCRQLAPTYPCLQPGLYALDTELPAAPGGQSSAWRVTAGGWLPWALTGLRAFAWIMTVLLLAGVTGLLRKT